MIIGLPRTGTTLLQHLLAQDPAHRVLRNWEATSPAPPPRPGDDDDPRIAASERGMKLLDYLAPDARALHPVAPTLPTECVTLFSNSCASLELATINYIPSYLRFCLETDMAPHYDYFRRQLLTLQWHDPRERWLLKSPAHLFWVGELLDALPGARVVQTHRDPLDVLASFCSLSAVLCGIGSDHVDQRALGELWAPVWAEGLERTRAVRAARPDDQFLDVDYPDLVGDPLGTVRRIYAGFDLELSPDRRAGHAALPRRAPPARRRRAPLHARAVRARPGHRGGPVRPPRGLIAASAVPLGERVPDGPLSDARIGPNERAHRWSGRADPDCHSESKFHDVAWPGCLCAPTHRGGQIRAQ